MGYLRARKRTQNGAPARGRTGSQRSQSPSQGKPQNEPRLPHERDESVGARDPSQSGSAASQRRIEQATDDIDRGLRDTERRGVPSDVPGKPASEERDRLADADPYTAGARRRPRSRFL
jgi:hypothetical protein